MNGTNYEVHHCGAFSTPHSHPSWAQIFASGSCFQIPLACIPHLMQETTYTFFFAYMEPWTATKKNYASVTMPPVPVRAGHLTRVFSRSTSVY